MEKDMIREAINDYDLYTDKQKKVLNTLVSVAVDKIAYVSVKSISDTINLAQNSTYVVLRALENDGFIERERSKGQKSNAYKLNEEKLERLVKIYYQKQAGLKENKNK